MTRLIIGAILMFMCACGPRDIPNSSPLVEVHTAPPSVESYVSQFELAWGHKMFVPIRIVTSAEMAREYQQDGPDTVVGLCFERDTGMQIYLLDDFWWHADDAARFVVSFHEMGHCALNLDHDPALMHDDSNCPRSIMNPLANGVIKCVETGQRNSLEYMNELFDSAT